MGQELAAPPAAAARVPTPAQGSSAQKRAGADRDGDGGKEGARGEDDGKGSVIGPL